MTKGKVIKRAKTTKDLINYQMTNVDKLFTIEFKPYTRLHHLNRISVLITHHRIKV